MFKDRRQDPRTPHHASVRLTDRARRFRATTTDISASGAFVATTEPPRIGSEIDVEVIGNDGSRVVVRAEVKRVAVRGIGAQPGVGVQWLHARTGADPTPLFDFLLGTLKLQDAEIVELQDGRRHAYSFTGELPDGGLRPDSDTHRAISRPRGAAVTSDAIAPVKIGRSPSSPPSRTMPPPAPRRAGSPPRGSSAMRDEILPPRRNAPPSRQKTPSQAAAALELEQELELLDAFAAADELPPPTPAVTRAPTPPPQPAVHAAELELSVADVAPELSSPELNVADTPQLSAPEHDITEREETTRGTLRRAFATVTGKLFGKRAEPVRMGSVAVSPDGWFYQPDGDGPLHRIADDDGNVVQQFRTGNARTAPPPTPRPRRSEARTSGGAAPATISGGWTPRVHSATVPRGDAGELTPVEVPCSFILFRDLCGGRIIAASRRAIRIVIEGEHVPRANQAIEAHVPVYDDGVYHTISVHGPVLSDPELVDNTLQFTLWIADVTEWGLKDGWERFLVSELGEEFASGGPEPSNEDTSRIEAPPRRKASNG